MTAEQDPRAGATGRGTLRRLTARGGLASDTGWATAAEVAQLVSGLVVFYLITTQLGPSGYGFFIGAQSLVATLAMLSSAWVALLLLQEVVRDGRPAVDAFPSCLTLVLLGGVLATGVSIALGSLLLPGLALVTLALFAVAELIGAALVTLGAALLQGSGDFRGSILARTALIAVRLLAVLSLVVADSVSLLSIAVAYATVSAAAGLTLLGLVRRRHGVPVRPSWPTRQMTRTGISYAGTLVSFAVQEDADKILLVRLADPATAGLYAAAYRAVQLALVPIRALTGSSHRRFLQHDPAQRGEHTGRALRYTAAASLYGAAAVVVLLVGAPLVPDLLGEDYRGSVPMIMLLAPLVLCRALSLFGFNGLMGLGRNGTRLVIIASAAVLNVVLNVVLIRQIDWVGAAVATLSAEVFLILSTWLALRAFQGRHDRSVPLRAPDRHAAPVGAGPERTAR